MPVALLALSLVATLMQAPPPEQAAVVATVQQFFDAMKTRDVEAMKRVLAADGSLVSVRAGADGQNGAPRATPSAGYPDSLARGTDTFLERMWNPEVRVNGPVATLWTRYDFHRNGTFTHCGIDAFTLVKAADGWKIASAAWTIETTNCPPSPLGPPK